MKLKKIKVAGIRGFNDEQTVDFDGKLIIYSGPNGGGKTSIGEAIEWLLYGKTLKRIKGDEISKREYAGSYRNTHYHGTASPFVEAEILDTSGKLRVIYRSLEIDESSTLVVDGKPSRGLEEFGVSALYDRPLILQHTLQDFIFMRPKTRYEVLSAMLGLEPLVEFRSAVEAARTEFQNRLPPSAVQARNRANLFLNTLIDGVEQWKDVEVSWRIDQISEDLQQLIRENRKFIEIKQKQTLGVRDQEIKNWYQLLTGTAQVGYAGIVPTTDNLELRARTFAKGMMAAPNLSSSQLNCIGLAVYLATCCRKGSPFKLILFDDPIQSMDDEHTEAFKKQVINKLLAQDFQVILLTHMDNFADAVELLYRAEHSCPN